MRDLVSLAIVRILGDAGEAPVGVGFLVGPNTVLTCAHVIRMAVDGNAPRLGTSVRVDFPLVDSGTVCSASVTVFGNEDATDIAVLSVENVPDGAEALRVVATGELAGHRVEVFGVTENRPQGVWASALVRGPIGGNELQIEDDRVHGVGVQRGFSGSPLVDIGLGAVVGMISRTESRDVRRTAYALTGTALYVASPELAGQAVQANPFRSLQPFRTEDAANFFGRKALCTELLERLDTHRVRLITGPSGAGKSSLVLAGMLPPILKSGAVAVTFRPAAGSSPWHALADGFATQLTPSATVAEVSGLAGRLRDGGIADALNRVLAQSGARRLVVVVDQLDEALAHERSETTAMLTALLKARARFDREPRVDLLVTVNSEALTEVLEDDGMAPWFSGRTDTVGAPTGPDLRAVAEGPLAAPGLPVFEEGLIDRLLEDVAGEQSPLALIEFTLTLLWERQYRGVLTHEAYQQLGGVVGALAQYAEEVCRPHLADDASAWRLRWVFGQLVSPVPPDRSTRRLIPLAELGGAADLARELAGSRLVTQRLSPGGVPAVELVHETLMRRWARLRDWVEQDRQFRTWQDELDRAAEHWEAWRDRSRLLRGSALWTALDYDRSRPADLTDRQRSLIRTSRIRYRRRIQSVTAVGTVLVLLAASLFVVVRDTNAAQAQRTASDAVTNLLQQARGYSGLETLDDVDRVIRAYRTQDMLSTREDLADLVGQLQYATGLLPGSFPGLAVRPVSSDGSAVILADPQDRLTVWTVTGAHPSDVVIPVPVSIAVTWLGPGRIATAERGARSSTVWDAHTGKRVGTLPFAGDLLVADPSGRWLAYGAHGGTTVQVADLSQTDRPSQVITLPDPLSSGPQSAAGTVTITDVLPGGELLGGDGGETTTAFGTIGAQQLPGPPAGQLLDNGGTDPWAVTCRTSAGTVTLQADGVVTGHPFGEYQEPPEQAVSGSCPELPEAVFSANGRDVAESASSNGSPGLYVGPVAGGLPAVPTPPGYSPYALVAEPSGVDRVLLVGKDSVLVLRVPKDMLRTAMAKATEAQLTGTCLVLAFDDGHLETWNTATRRRIAATTASSSTGRRDRRSITLDPDGSLVAVIDSTRPSLSLFRLPDLRPAGQVSLAPLGPSTRLVQFTSDRITLLYSEDENSADEYSVIAEQRAVPSLRPLAGPVPVGSDVNPGNTVDGIIARNGSSTVVELAGPHIRQLDLRSGAVLPGSDFTLPGGLTESGYGITAVLDSSGQRLAIVHARGIEVWDLGTHQQVGRLPLTDGTVVTGMRFRDSSDLEVDLSDESAGYRAGPVLTELWSLNQHMGLAKLVGGNDPSPTIVSDPMPSELTEEVPGGQYFTVRSSDPRQWLKQICGAWQGGDQDALPIVTGSYTGSVCAGY